MIWRRHCYISTSMQHLQQIQQLIASGKLKDAIRLAMDDALESKETKLYNCLIHLSGRCECLEEDKNLGIITREHYTTEFAQVSQTLISYIHGDFPSLPLPPEDHSHEYIDILLEKLDYFKKEYATTADAARKFELKKRIEEIKSELGNRRE